MHSARSTAAGLSALLLLASVACGGATPGPSPRDPLAGTYNASGGGGALMVVQSLTKGFGEVHPGVNWTIDNVGSDASVNLVATSATDFGFISRELKSDEAAKVGKLSIGASGTAIVVNASNPVTNLTKQQVADVFSGKVTDWKDVGGVSGPIRVFVREPTAATRTVFEDYFFGGKATIAKTAIEVTQIDATIDAISSFAGAVGMITLDNRALGEPKLKLIALDGVPATLASLASGDWKVRRPLYLIFATDPAKRKPVVNAFLDFVRGPEGQKILAGS